MNVRPMLADWEMKRVASLDTLEARTFVELPVPGRVGSLFQDLNTAPTRIVIRGSLYQEEERTETIESLRGPFREGTPVTFVADIVAETEVQYVLIETLQFEESGRRPDELDYLVVLRESPPPPPPPDPLGGLDTGLLDEAGGFLDSLSGALDLLDGLGSVPDVSDPTPPLTSALDGVTTATEGLDDTLAPLRDIFGSDN